MLDDVGAVEAVDAVGADDAFLALYYFYFDVFSSKTACTHLSDCVNQFKQPHLLDIVWIQVRINQVFNRLIVLLTLMVIIKELINYFMRH